MKNTWAVIIGLIFVALFISGCGSDSGTGPPDPSPFSAVRGRVTELQTGEPMSGVQMLLVDAGTLAAVRNPTLTDAQGRYSFTGLVPGEFAVFVYHNSHVTFDRSASTLIVGQGQTVTQDIRFTDSELWSGAGYRIEGTVTDATSGEPIAGAYVADTGSAFGGIDIFALLAGVSVTSWGVTNAQGFFSVGTQLATNEVGELLGLWPITCVKDGYRAGSLVGTNPIPTDGFGDIGAWLPMPADGDTVLTVSIQLRPLAGFLPEEFGSLSGRLLHMGSPVAGVDVAVSLFVVADPETLHAPTDKVLVPDRMARTDANGVFIINGLDPGGYSLVPGYRLGDGYSGVNWINDAMYTVTANDTTFTGDVEIVREILPVYPADGSVINSPTPLVTWEPVPNAIWYSMGWAVDSYIEDHGVYRLATPSYQIPEWYAVPNGSCVRWWVSAFGLYPTDQDTVMIAQTEWSTTFCVQQ